jgi:hypothetical protein
VNIGRAELMTMGELAEIIIRPTIGMNAKMDELQAATGRQVLRLDWGYSEQNRLGDHIWWVSNVRKFQSHYPDWSFKTSR